MSIGQVLASGRAELEAQAAFQSLGLSTIQSAPAPEDGEQEDRMPGQWKGKGDIIWGDQNTKEEMGRGSERNSRMGDYGEQESKNWGRGRPQGGASPGRGVLKPSAPSSGIPARSPRHISESFFSSPLLRSREPDAPLGLLVAELCTFGWVPSSSLAFPRQWNLAQPPNIS